MKKLLITTMAAVSVGLCAKADLTAETFESYGEGSLFGTLTGDSSKYNITDGWETETTLENLFTVTNIANYVGAGTYPEKADRPSKSDSVKALAIDTSAPLLRYADSSEGSQSLSDAPIFFDSVVQFTATDVAPSMENNTTDKLAVWLYTSPDDVSDTNLGLFGETSPITRVAITAGYLEDGATVKVRNYLTNIEVDPNTWHRLTIKSFVRSGRPWYSVWVDKTPVNGKAAIDAEEELTEFLSMVSDEVNTDTYTKLQGVAFDGKGAVDDIVFTTTDPFAVASYKVTVTIDDPDDWTDGCPKQYSINGENYVDFSAETPFDIPQTATKIWFKLAMPADVKLEGVQEYASEYENGGYYWIKEVNVADIISNDEGEVVLKVVDNTGTPEVTTYAVTVNSANATVVGLAEKYAADAAVIFAVTANQGYEVVSVMMNTTALSANAEGKYSFTMPAEAVTITVTTKAIEEEVTYPSVGGVETPEYSDNAKAAIDAAFPENSYPTGGLTVKVNGETLTGAPAVAMLNEAVEMFILAGDAKFFDEDGVMDISFKATGADPEAVAYEAKVGGLAATVNETSYEVVPKYIDIAKNTELQAKPEGTVTFRLVIQKK